MGGIKGAVVGVGVGSQDVWDSQSVEVASSAPGEVRLPKMMRVVPNRWFSNEFTIFDRETRPVGRVDLSKGHGRESTELEVGGRRYKAHGKGYRAKEFVLETEDSRARTLPLGLLGEVLLL